jgi:hypothetical protein
MTTVCPKLSVKSVSELIILANSLAESAYVILNRFMLKNTAQKQTTAAIFEILEIKKCDFLYKLNKFIKF